MVDSLETREQTILAHTPLVRALARRYADRGEPLDDLVQVGMVGLIKAVDRFDPDRGTDLVSFATPTILGEIRRHFRDRTWGMRVPRPIQEARVAVTRAVDRLRLSLGRSPTVAEVASATDLTEEEVLDAMAAAGAYRPMSLSHAGPGGSEEDVALDIPSHDEGFGAIESRLLLAEGLRRLPARERVIVHLRFQEGLTQSEIADRVGISQMHVSRLLARALETLRRSTEPG